MTPTLTTPVNVLSLLHFDEVGLTDAVTTNSVDASESLHELVTSDAFNAFAVTNQVYAIYQGAASDGRLITNGGLTIEGWVLPQTIAGLPGLPKFNHITLNKATASEELYAYLRWVTDDTGVTTFYGGCSATKNYVDYTGDEYSAVWSITELVHVALVLTPSSYSVYIGGARVATGVFSSAEYPDFLTWDNGAYFEVRCSSTSTAFRTDEARLSNVARYSGATITVPSTPFLID